MYTYDIRVGFSQSDIEQKMTLPAVVDCFQDCSCFQSDELGVGFYYLQPKGLVWIINYWELEIVKMPQYFDKITVGTFPYDFKGFIGLRNFFLKDENGEYLVKANSMWVLMDWEKQIPTRMPREVSDRYEIEPKLDMVYSKRKIVISDSAECVPQDKLIVQPHHLDFNGHVNNGQYIKIAMSMIPRKTEYTRLRVEYRAQAHLGDVMCPILYKTEDTYTVCLNNEEGAPYAIVELMHK